MIVADMHVLVWLTSRDERLGEQARELADVAFTECRFGDRPKPIECLFARP